MNNKKPEVFTKEHQEYIDKLAAKGVVFVSRNGVVYGIKHENGSLVRDDSISQDYEGLYFTALECRGFCETLNAKFAKPVSRVFNVELDTKENIPYVDFTQASDWVIANHCIYRFEEVEKRSIIRIRSEKKELIYSAYNYPKLLDRLLKRGDILRLKDGRLSIEPANGGAVPEWWFIRHNVGLEKEVKKRGLFCQ